MRPIVGFDDRPADGEAHAEAGTPFSSRWNNPDSRRSWPPGGSLHLFAQLVFTMILAGRARHGRDRPASGPRGRLTGTRASRQALNGKPPRDSPTMMRTRQDVPRRVLAPDDEVQRGPAARRLGSKSKQEQKRMRRMIGRAAIAALGLCVTLARAGEKTPDATLNLSGASVAA